MSVVQHLLLAVLTIEMLAADRPVVNFVPNFHNVLENNPVTMSCDTGAARPQEEIYHWYKDGELVLNQDEWRFVIKSTGKSDAGYYRCRTATSDYSEAVRLEVAEGSVILVQKPAAVSEGDSLTLKCSYPNGRFGKDTAFYKDDEVLMSSATENELHLSSVDGNMTGIYRCTQMLDLGDRIYYLYQAETFINVGGAAFRPTVTFTPNVTKLFSDEILTASCNAAPHGHENQRYYWYRNFKLMADYQKDLLLRDGYDVTANYQCRIRTSDFSDPVKFEETRRDLVILKRPPTVHVGDSMTLSCQPNPKHKAKMITFYKDGVQIKNSTDDLLLHIDKVDRNASGRYQCSMYVEFNGIDKLVSDESVIVVRDPFTYPVIKTNPRHATTGAAVTLRCATTLDSAKSGMDLQFAFYKGGRVLQDFSADDTFRIPAVRTGDFGSYSCTARAPSISLTKESNTFQFQEGGGAAEEPGSANPGHGSNSSAKQILGNIFGIFTLVLLAFCL